MLSLKSRIWERLQNNNNTSQYLQPAYGKGKKKRTRKRGSCSGLKETWETYQLNVMHRPYLDLVLNSPIIKKIL